MGVCFRGQVRFPTCKDIACLPFDFEIHQGKKTGLIEYQGQQHFQPVTFGGSIDPADCLRYVISHDIIKHQWCCENNVPLLVIPYWEQENMQSLIEDFVDKISNAN
jgi:hypothetical protein